MWDGMEVREGGGGGGQEVDGKNVIGNPVFFTLTVAVLSSN